MRSKILSGLIVIIFALNSWSQEIYYNPGDNGLSIKTSYINDNFKNSFELGLGFTYLGKYGVGFNVSKLSRNNSFALKPCIGIIMHGDKSEIPLQLSSASKITYQHIFQKNKSIFYPKSIITLETSLFKKFNLIIAEIYASYNLEFYKQFVRDNINYWGSNRIIYGFKFNIGYKVIKNDILFLRTLIFLNENKINWGITLGYCI